MYFIHLCGQLLFSINLGYINIYTCIYNNFQDNKTYPHPLKKGEKFIGCFIIQRIGSYCNCWL
jgi:hypothetical protein